MSKWSDGADLLQKIITAKDVIPIQSDLITLQQTMFSLQNDQLKLIDENSDLRAKVSSLESRIKLEKNLEFDGKCYWSNETESKDGPFCALCWDVEKRLVRKPKTFCPQCISKNRHA